MADHFAQSEPAVAQYAATEEREETQVEKEHRQQTDYALQGVWFLDEEELIATNLIGNGLTRYDRSQSGYTYDFYNSHFTIRHFDNYVGKSGENKLVANGTYTIRYDEKTGDTTLRLYTYATETESPAIIFQFTVYQLNGSGMELRTLTANSEKKYKLSRWNPTK